MSIIEKRERAMGRPPLCRRVSYIPAVTYFKPASIPLRELEEICLSVEEVEAIRLKDLEDLEQEQCAEEMNISRPTFVRILDSARKKVAEALIKGRAVRIEGGNYEIAVRRYCCRNNHEWEIPAETSSHNPPQACPTCSTQDIAAVQSSVPGQGQGKRCRRGKNR